MKTRFTSLKKKFRPQYQRLQELRNSFLVKVIRWKSRVLNVAEQENLQFLPGTYAEFKEINKSILKQFKAEK
jgi:hypothetical protein